MRRGRAFPVYPVKAPPEPPPPPSRFKALKQRLGRFRSILLVGSGILIALTSMFAFDMFQSPPQRLTQKDIDRAVERALESMPPGPSVASQAYTVIRPSMVHIRTVISRNGGKPEGATGAGVVIEDSGLILTSMHIIDEAREIHVTFADGTESEASVLVKQSENDIAVIRAQIIPDDLKPATLNSAASLHIGDEVVAVGHPFGISFSASAGVVSGLGRRFQPASIGVTLTNLIQFDAAVNPGNSGGPLVNRDGEVVGIVTGILNPIEEEFFVGIGFAVPIESAVAAAGSPPY